MDTKAPTPTLIADLRALPRPFWVLLIGTFINRFGTFVMPFLTIYLSKSGYTLAKASYAISAFGLGALCGSMLGGWLADRIGRRNTIVAGAFAAGGFYLLLHFAGTFPQIVLCTFFAGLSAATYPPASGALLTDVVPEHLRVRAFAALRVALNAGFACGAATAGFVAKYSYFWLFVGDALTTVAYGLIALFALPHGIRSSRQQAPWSEALRHARRNRPFLGVVTAAFLTSVVFMQFGTTYSAYVISLGLSFDIGSLRLSGESLYGMLIGWNGILVMTAELPITTYTQRRQPRLVMAIGYVLIGVGFALNGAASGVLFLLFAMTVLTIGEMISMPVSSAYVAQLAPEHMRGRYMGLLNMNWSLASIIAPPIAFRLLEANPMYLWISCGALGSAAALTMITVGRKRPTTVAKIIAEPAPVG
jgi:MFS family permease